MEFKAKVTVVDTAEEINKKRETERAKKLLLEAFQILSKNDDSSVMMKFGLMCQ